MILRENSSIWRTDSVLPPHLSSSVLTPPQALSLQILRLRLMDRRSLSDWQSPNPTSEDAAILARRIAQVSDARPPSSYASSGITGEVLYVDCGCQHHGLFESIRSKTTKYRDNKIALSLNSDVIPTARVFASRAEESQSPQMPSASKIVVRQRPASHREPHRAVFDTRSTLCPLCALCVKDFDLPASATTIQISDGPARQEIHSHLVTSNLAPHINFVS